MNDNAPAHRTLAVRSAGPDPPAWRQALSDEYWNLASWRMSRKGNAYVMADGKPVTMYRDDDGWRWSIGRSDRAGGPIYSPYAYRAIEDARQAAFEALIAIAKPPPVYESTPMERDNDAPPIEDDGYVPPEWDIYVRGKEA